MIDYTKDLYEPHVHAARARIASDPGIARLLDPSIDPVLLERFLIQFTSLGVQMTEPVEGWIRRAGERCVAIGLHDLGRALVKHAKHESGHHLMMIADTRALVERWNARRASDPRRRRLCADQAIAQRSTRAIREYVRVHEETIGGATPFGQIAIEFEIERLSIVLGPRLIEHCLRVLGRDVMRGLSFLREHVDADVGHTQLNAKLLERLLRAADGMGGGTLAPRHLGTVLGRIGARALGAYLDFLNDCLRTASDDLESRPVLQVAV